MFAVQRTAYFRRQAARFFRKHPDLLPRFEQVVRALREDPWQPRLRLHGLKGTLEDIHAVSLTYAYRVTLRLDLAQREITLLDIGTHDDVYR